MTNPDARELIWLCDTAAVATYAFVDVVPHNTAAAARALMDAIVDAEDLPPGQTREVTAVLDGVTYSAEVHCRTVAARHTRRRILWESPKFDLCGETELAPNDDKLIDPEDGGAAVATALHDYDNAATTAEQVNAANTLADAVRRVLLSLP